MIKEFWGSLGEKVGRSARVGLVAGALMIVGVTVAAGYWLLRTDYQVLFADLAPQDTAAMTAELERMKTGYILEERGGGTTILVDKKEVYKARIKLMGTDIPLHGAIGFELFNNSDFGMTEFAQKINYQRALQGELTRTILSLAEIRDARVLLVLPEQGLFRQSGSKPKASVTITMKPGQRLRSEQVAGIQRLVAAAVPGILGQDVTLVDQSGVALSRASGDGVSDQVGGGGSLRLDLKRETEDYLARKAAAVLDRALGPGQAMASLDVTLDMDRVQSNTDEVLPAPGKEEDVPSGVLVRQRESVREAPAPLNVRGNADGSVPSPGDSRQNESEYVVGHRVEQVIRHPGSIQCMKVAVVTQHALAPEQQESLRKMVAASVGASFDRGDEVIVHTAQTLNPDATSQAPQASAGMDLHSDMNASTARRIPTPPGFPWSSFDSPVRLGMWVLAGLFVLSLGGWWFLRLGMRRSPRHQASSSGKMSHAERARVLSQVEAWLEQPPSPSRPSATDGAAS